MNLNVQAGDGLFVQKKGRPAPSILRALAGVRPGGLTFSRWND